MIQSYHAMLLILSNKEGGFVDKCYDMDETQNNCVGWKKLEKIHTLYDYLPNSLENTNLSIMTENVCLSPGVGFGRQGLQEITRKPLEVIDMFIILTAAVVSQKHIYVFKCIHLYTSNMYILLHINYTLIKQFYKWILTIIKLKYTFLKLVCTLKSPGSFKIMLMPRFQN